ncbi:WD repeat-containing protein on Y chromosome-like isoform X1 [Notolabrus celidotus]|uniref:WD repeat-containing protein on Y chromosome-like isoform X1 n=1 Tax=Notolabrus celidotus TaxID=1203425 RepID=UPI0014905CD8|nr:WD repeat-containing protein on Y chromosome-like isoform X1 [Notolabrus celidotus]
MTSQEVMEKDFSEEAPVKNTDMEFTAEDIPRIVKIFQEADADGSTGLDVDEFREAMKKIDINADDSDMEALHMKIDTNCDSVVDLEELLTFLEQKNKTAKNMDSKKVFPKPLEIVKTKDRNPIVKMIFCPLEGISDPDHYFKDPTEQERPFVEGQYHSITSGGVVSFWSDRFDSPRTLSLYKDKAKLPFSHKKKVCVNDAVFMPELSQLAVCGNDREVKFYKYIEKLDMLYISHSLIVEDQLVSCMNYWSDGTKAVFAMSDTRGFLYIFTSNNVRAYGLFCKESYEEISLMDYPTVYVSSLMENTSPRFMNAKVSTFKDSWNQITQISYIPSLNSHAVCCSSSKEMILVSLSKQTKLRAHKTTFRSDRCGAFFTCVEYLPGNERLVTGGMNGSLYVWIPDFPDMCEQVLKGHRKPIKYIMDNKLDKVLISISEDKNVRVWNTVTLECNQSMYVDNLPRSQMTGAYYNTLNNELIVSTSHHVVKNLGRGTDLFQRLLTSHDKPLCAALYHSIFKQLVSVCQNGVVKVRDITTGKEIIQFKITPDQQEGLYAVTFDGPQRRLITIAKDGKVKLWNFNTGQLLDVLPVTVQKEVTAILCREEKIYVSGRNSSTIFILDLENNDHSFLEHAFLTDISSMDFYENTLTATSSNGNTVVWDVEAEKAIYWINPSKSPQTNMVNAKSKEQMGRTGNLRALKRKKKVKCTGTTNLSALQGEMDCVKSLHLKTRDSKADTATLLTSADGYIFAYSPKIKGGLIGKFRAVKDDGAVITAMTVDVEEHSLLAGDSKGRAYVWDIQNFWDGKQSFKDPFEDIKGWRVSVCPPPLLASWQAHHKRVVDIGFESTCGNIFTAGYDCKVELWTKTGRHIGLFGKDSWDLTTSSPQMSDDLEFKERPGTEEDNNQKQAERAGTWTHDDQELEENPDMIWDYENSDECRKVEKLLRELEERYGKPGKKSQCTAELLKTPMSKEEMDKADGGAMRVVPEYDLAKKDKDENALRKLKAKPPKPKPPKPQDEPLFFCGYRLCPPDPLPETQIYSRRAKYGRVIRIQQREIVNDKTFTPCPPNYRTFTPCPPNDRTFTPCPPKQDRFQQTQECVGPTSTHDLLQQKQDPAELELTTGSPSRSSHFTQGPNPLLTKRSKLPPNTLNQQPEQKPKPLRFPPIHDRVTKLTTGCDSPSKYGRVVRIPQKEIINDRTFTPCPPKHDRFQQTQECVGPTSTHDLLQQKQDPAELELTTGSPSMSSHFTQRQKTLLTERSKLPPNTLNQQPERKPKPLRLPPIHDRVTKLTTGCDSPSTSSHFTQKPNPLAIKRSKLPPNTRNQRPGPKPKHVCLPPIQDRVTPPTTGHAKPSSYSGYIFVLPNPLTSKRTPKVVALPPILKKISTNIRLSIPGHSKTH